MKKLNLLTLLVCGYLFSGAQVTTVSDSVSTEPNNIYRVYYNLATGGKVAVSDTDWHLAFSVSQSMTVAAVTIRINGHIGVSAWVAENNDTTTFTSLTDTNGLALRPLIDDDYNLGEGALNSNANPNNAFDFGWGLYNENTHNLNGDSVFLIQLPDGSFKKFFVEDLNYDTAWDIEYANLDNSQRTYLHIPKLPYANKEFVYLNLETDSILDKEPAATYWDLLFLKYEATNVPGLPPGWTTYPVAGVWVNPLITAARDSGVNVDSNSYAGLRFTDTLNTIGWNFVNYNMNTNTYSVVPSQDYFIKGNDANYYKLVFTNSGYGTDATGVFYFDKTQLTSSTAVQNVADPDLISIFPNPARQTLNIMLSQPATSVQIADISGRVISDLHVTNKFMQIDISSLASGVYILSVKGTDNISTSKFVVTH